MIDFHSHILPGIDDGSRNTEYSLEMLSRSEKMGVTDIIATPHFYPTEDRIESFLLRREGAAKELLKALQDVPHSLNIYLGAEAAFFKGISGAEDISKLTILGTNVILIEMPYGEWDDEDLEEVISLVTKRKLTVVLAHIERFIHFPKNKKLIRRLIEERKTKAILRENLFLQVNAESMISSLTEEKKSFSEKRLSKKCLQLFETGDAHLLGSDCHGIHRRVPNLDNGYAALKEYPKTSDQCDAVDALARKLLTGAVRIQEIYEERF